MLDAQGRVQTWNLGARTIKGYAPDEIVGQTIHRFYTPDDRAETISCRLLDLMMATSTNRSASTS